ncbi:MAG: Rieske (2Fe-2S) protein [Planctomycetota bacterium]
MNEEPQTAYDEDDCTWTVAMAFPQGFSPSDEIAHECIVGQRILAVFHHEGRWYAIDGMCSHQGGPLAQGHVEAGCVTCPWHGWQYELATGVQTINRQPLQSRYRTRVVGNAVEVAIPNSEAPIQ